MATVEMEDPLDFEFEDPLLRPPSLAKLKRRKVIGLDDLLNDHYNEGTKHVEKQDKAPKKKRNHARDDDEDRAQYNKERQLSKFVENFQKQVHEMATDEDIPLWGVQVFGHQEPLPEVDFSDLKSCKLLNFLTNDMTGMMMKSDLAGERFFEGLLKNGWLHKLVSLSGYVEDPIASWAFNRMMYSSDGELHSSACDFCCNVLLSKQISMTTPGSRCFSYSATKVALRTYGYLFGQFGSSTTKLVETDSRWHGPPSNIKSWLIFVSTLCKSRYSRSTLLSTEIEELLSIILSLFLERKLQGLAFLLDECLGSVVSSFSDEEWDLSCENTTATVADRLPKDLNCLHVLESISSSSSRTKELRSGLAFQLLVHFHDGVIGAEGIVKFLSSVNAKEKNCDFFKVYIYLVLVENWLCSDSQVEEKQIILETWFKFLRNCSVHITSTDWRLYASKVRNRASYLIQTKA